MQHSSWRARFSEEDHPCGWLTLGLSRRCVRVLPFHLLSTPFACTPLSAFLFRFANTRAVLPYHPSVRRLARCFPYTFRILHPYMYTFLVRLPAPPCPPALQLPTTIPILRALLLAHSPRLPLPTGHIHPVSLLVHTLSFHPIASCIPLFSVSPFLHFRAHPRDPPTFLPSPAFPHPSFLPSHLPSSRPRLLIRFASPKLQRARKFETTTRTPLPRPARRTIRWGGTGGEEGNGEEGVSGFLFRLWRGFVGGEWGVGGMGARGDWRCCERDAAVHSRVVRCASSRNDSEHVYRPRLRPQLEEYASRWRRGEGRAVRTL
ncbi:hypothetical protein B0H16DRAFT_1887243 [Mycena metata]|uniref:Uncharacterized protein n=1 Tax=Mycena metata TaxID=1033252 RepID=A0AAD7NB34_9AGAR|nr:hypothetical protein B0H16DRAFT_1887243 [Mycena metata]